MRRLAALTTVFLLVLGGTVTGLTTAASAAGASVTPGSVWTLQTPTACETDAFTTTHAFATAIDYGTGDAGTYRGAKTLKMTWTAGTAAGVVFKATWRKATGAYRGTYTDGASSVAATLSPASIVGCPMVTTTPSSSSVVLGSSVSDAAAVAGADGVVPTGTVSFSVCGPEAAAAACDPDTATSLGAAVDVTGSDGGSGPLATATGPTFSPTATGTYCFVGVYSGDTVYSSAADGSAADECFSVTPAGPAFTTAPSASSIVLGNAVSDTATVIGVGGAVPTGSVTFAVCGPEDAAATCTAGDGTPLGSAVDVLPSAGLTAVATSDSFTPASTGTYCFVGSYSGDTNFDPAGDGSATDECFSVTAATPTVVTAPSAGSVALGAVVSDTATVTGVGTTTPTGSVSFTVCPGDAAPCTPSSSGALPLGSSSVSGTGASATATSAAFTPTEPGTYCFAGAYGGDSNYGAGADASTTDECFTVTATGASPLGLGSPENSFGTGPLDLGAGPPTNTWAAVNGYCTSKENGDEFLSAFDGTWNGDGWQCSDTQTGETPNATDNYEYNGADGASAGYSYDIVTPPSAGGTTTADISVQAYDPAYEPAPCPSVTGPVTAAGGQSPDLTAGGPDTTITTDYTLTYAPVPGQDADDQPVAGVSGPYVAPSGDPSTCGQWATLFTIPAGSPDGFYRLQVTTPQSPGQDSDGINAYGLRVYEGDSFTRCSTLAGDAWYSPSCPVISGQAAVSTYDDAPSSSGSFYLAQVPASDAGQTVDVNLFDPGEGDKDIQIVDPDGNAVPFTWQTTDDCPLPAPNAASTDCAEDLGFGPLSGSGTALDVSGTIASPPGMQSDSEFNDRRVTLAVSVPADYTADNGGWWQIRYTSTNGQVQDRVTWSVLLAPPADNGQPPLVSSVRRSGAAHRNRHHHRGHGATSTTSQAVAQLYPAT